MDLHEDVVVHDLADVRHGEDRFHPRRGVGDDGNRPRRGDGGDRSVAEGGLAFFGIEGSAEIREGAPLFRQMPGGVVTLLLDELHHLPGQRYRLLGIVGDPQHDQHVRPAHYAQADLTVAEGHLGNDGQGVSVDLHDVVEKMDGQMDHLPEAFPVHGAARHHLA